MRKNIKQASFFLLLVFAVVSVIQYGIDMAYKKRVNNKFIQVFKHEVDAEVMIFGSSVAYHQFDPQVIKDLSGKEAYNMGFPGMFFVQYNGLIKEYLSYQKHCKAIVIACDFDNLGKNNLATRPDLFLAYLNNENIYNSMYEIEPRKAFLARYMPGYKLTLLNKSFYTDIALAKPYISKHSGFEPLDSKFEVTKKAPFSSRYDESVYTQFRETIGAINKKGVKVVLVIPPVYEEGYKLIRNADTIKSKYHALVSKDVYFLDYTSDTLCRSQSNFRNFTHLNSTGATAFSHTFAQDLLKIVHE